MPKIPGRIVTFYSYKGGTGRSMALANFAWILAACGKQVLAIDWDLEAPGLHRYFRPFLADPDLFETDGLIDMFWDLTVSAVQRVDSTRDASTANLHSYPSPPGRDRSAMLDQIDFDKPNPPFVAGKPNWSAQSEHGNAVIDALEDATRRIDSRIGDKNFFPPGGHLDFIGAGRQGSTYSEHVNSFSWKRFWELGGPDILDLVKDYLRENYDWVLIDSRTGVSDTSGISTIHMPDTVVAFFTLNRQSIEGVAAILQSISSFQGHGVDGSKIGFFPIATRIENAEKQKLELARGYARRVLGDYLPKAMRSNPREYWDKMEIGYRPAYAFEETLAAFGDATGAAGSIDTMLTQVELTSQQIAGDSTLRMPEIGEVDRQQILSKYALGTSTPTAAAESGDSDFLRNLRAKEQRWRTSGSKWQLLLSRKELDLLTEEDRKSFGRNMGYYVIQSERMWKLLRIGQIIGSSVFLLVMLAGLITVFFSSRFNVLVMVRYLPFTSFLVVLSVVLGAWVAAAAARTLVAAIRDKPEGVGLPQVILISLTGPAGLRVDDYQVDERKEKKERTIRIRLAVVGLILVLLGIGLYIIENPTRAKQ
jgi:cellulose biosynthesis protein BcsQ